MINQIGMWKFIAERALNYFGKAVTLVNFILLINVSAKLGDDMMQYLPWAILSCIAGVLFMAFDILVILPQENKFNFDKNPFMKDIKDDLDAIKAKLEVK